MVQPPYKTLWQFLKKLNTWSSDPAVQLLGNFTQEKWKHVPLKDNVNVCNVNINEHSITLLFIIKK